MEAGRLTHKGKAAVIEDAFADFPTKGSSAKNSPASTPAASTLVTPAGSKVATPAGSGDEEGKEGSPLNPAKKRKKLTRNQLKAQEERRRQRKLQWLITGGPKPDDTDSD